MGIPAQWSDAAPVGSYFVCAGCRHPAEEHGSSCPDIYLAVDTVPAGVCGCRELEPVPVTVAFPSARFTESGRFSGHQPRQCRQHWAVNALIARCESCNSWCEPHHPCRGCR